MTFWRQAAAAALLGLSITVAVDGDFGAPGYRTEAAPLAQTAELIAEHPAPPPPPAPTALQQRLEALAAAYGEPVGIAVIDVDAGWIAAVDGQGVYPQQSVSKLWVALALLEAVDRGELSLHDAVLFTHADRSVFYQPIVRRMGEHGLVTTYEDLLRRAIVASDNAANDKLIRQLGGARRVAETLEAKKLTGVAIGAEERDLQARIAGLSWEDHYGYGQAFKEARAALLPSDRDATLAAYLDDPADGATPIAIAGSLAALKRGELLTPYATDVLLKLLADTETGPNRLKAGLPQGWSIAHKTGTGQDWRGASIGINDVGLITAPDGRTYAVAVMIRRTWKPVPQRLRFMQSVSRAIAEHWAAESDAPARKLTPA